MVHLGWGIMSLGITIYQQLQLETFVADIPDWQC